MATQLTPEVFGQEIPVHQMNEMAKRIRGGIGGGKPVAFAGFVWYRPQPPIPNLVFEKVRVAERQVA